MCECVSVYICVLYVCYLCDCVSSVCLCKRRLKSTVSLRGFKLFLDVYAMNNLKLFVSVWNFCSKPLNGDVKFTLPQ